MLYSFQQGLNMPPKRDPERRLLLLPIDEIRMNPNRSRQTVKRAALSELMISIAQVGLIQPLTVRQLADGYELIAGERRLRACKLLGYRELPCIVMSVNDEKSAAMSLIENVQREALEPLEEARGMQAFSDAFRLSDEQLSVRLGKSEPYLSARLRLLNRAAARRAELHKSRIAMRPPIEPERVTHPMEPSAPPADKQQPMRIRRVPKDCRLFVNSVKSCIEQLDGTGIAATMEETRLEDGFDLVIHVRT